MTPMVQADRVYKSYGALRVLNGMSLEVPRAGLRVTRGAPKFWSRAADSGRRLRCAFCPSCVCVAASDSSWPASRAQSAIKSTFIAD